MTTIEKPTATSTTTAAVAATTTENHSISIQNFMNTGTYEFDSKLIKFIHPVRILNQSYTHYKVSPSCYYSRFFTTQQLKDDIKVVNKKRKRCNNKNKKKKQQLGCCVLNEKELSADLRHKEIRGLLVKAHEELMRNKELLDVICELNCEIKGYEPCVELDSNGLKQGEQVSFIELGKIWQTPLYEIALNFTPPNDKQIEDNEGSPDIVADQNIFPLFNNLVSNETDNDVVAEFQTCRYILPNHSCFYMSELEQIHTFVPADSEHGFNLIMIDPPWENRSAYQKSKYPTLPNRHFLSIPIKQLTHTSGALVALWVTNREKLRGFVENELFPAWEVNYVATLYWLKVKPNGSLICDLDLFHHRPYECLLLGYTGRHARDSELLSMAESLKDQVVMTIPGDYSRKPPLGELLMEYVPGPRPARCIELFAREMMAGWTSWGNEPLHFQDLRYFSRKTTVKSDE